MKSPCGHLVDVSLRPKCILFVSVLAFNALGSLLCPFVYTKTSCPDFNPLPVTDRLGQTL